MSTKRILVIEDDEFVQSMLSISLQKEGYDITCANDGQIGFNKAVTENYDLILTDIKMPKWSGAESIYGLNLVNNKTKIIVISGFMEDDLKEELLEFENVIKIYPKPFNTVELLDSIRKVFKGI